MGNIVAFTVSVCKGVPFRKRLSRNAEFVVGLDGVNDLL